MSTDADIEALKAAVPPGIVDSAWRGVIGTLAYQRNDPAPLADAKDRVLRVLAADAEARTQPQPASPTPEPEWDEAWAKLIVAAAPVVIAAIQRAVRIAEQRGMGE